MSTVLITILIFVLMIIMHECGHFISAKLLGVRVDEFSIGFGPAIFKKKKGDTLYAVRCVPFGGYVSMGEDDKQDDDPRSFNNRPIWARIIVIVAGGLVNIITGLIVFILISANVSSYVGTTIESVSPDQPAANYLQAGDEILYIDGHRVHLIDDIVFGLSYHKGDDLAITVKRDGQQVELSIPHQAGSQLGIKTTEMPMNFGQALRLGFYKMLFVIKLVFYSIIMLFTGAMAITEMSGPVGIGSVVGEVSSAGFLPIAEIFGLISVNLGMFNLLPFPALDGGRLVFLLYELVFRRKIPPEKEGWVHVAGFVLLFGLMIFVTFNDIIKLVSPMFGA